MDIELKPYFYRSDDSGHDYLVSEDVIYEFDRLTDSISSAEQYSDEWYDLIETFNVEFSKYCYGGGLNDIRLWIDPTEL